MQQFDLDYDDALAAEVLRLKQASEIPNGYFDALPLVVSAGKPVTQGGADVAVLGLNCALVVAQEIYGETNSRFSGLFCLWVKDVRAGATTIRATKELLQLLHKDKDSFSGRWSLYRRRGVEQEAIWLRARWMAVLCAENVIRATLNELKGINNEVWLTRAFYRATLTEDDIKYRR